MTFQDKKKSPPIIITFIVLLGFSALSISLIKDKADKEAQQKPGSPPITLGNGGYSGAVIATERACYTTKNTVSIHMDGSVFLTRGDAEIRFQGLTEVFEVYYDDWDSTYALAGVDPATCRHINPD